MLLMGVGESYLSLLVIDSCALLSRSQPDDLEETGVERGSTKRSSLRGPSSERGPSSVRRTLEPFQRQRWGNF